MRKQSVMLTMVVVFVAALGLAACGSKATATPGSEAAKSPTEVHVKLTDFKIELDRTSIPAGPVKFVIDNAGTIEHEVVLEPVGAVDKPFESGDKEAEAPDIEAGKSSTLEWTLDQPGEYQLGCHIAGHYEAGMVTTFTVTAP